MFTKKEISSVLIVSFLLGIVISLVENLNLFLSTTLSVFLIIALNTLGKKITAFYLDTDIEIKIWEMQQFGYKSHMRTKKPFLAGIFVPLIIKFLSIGLINWMVCLTFDASGRVYRAARRHGIYSFSEVTEEEMGGIAGAGIIATLVFALVGYLIGQETFSVLSITYAFFNLIPAFDWDGAKIFFGNKVSWSVLAVVTSLAMIATIFII